MSRTDAFNVGSSPDARVAAGAAAYQRQSGLRVPTQDFSHVAMNLGASKQIASAYDRMPEFDSGAVPAYKQMAEETGRQFDHLTAPVSKGGMGIDVDVTKHDPYGADTAHSIFGELKNDVNENNRIQVLSTKSTGGHPVFSDDQNDMFRAVHDIFGHLGTGRGVDKHGEEAAFQKHASMFSPLARAAMATETRGQNAALHAHGAFQNQKVGLLPHAMQGAAFARGGSLTDRVAALREARSKNNAQGI